MSLLRPSALESQGLLSNYISMDFMLGTWISEGVHDWALALEQRNSVHSLFFGSGQGI